MTDRPSLLETGVAASAVAYLTADIAGAESLARLLAAAFVVLLLAFVGMILWRLIRGASFRDAWGRDRGN